jgi:single-strand DNA-binding protein
MSHTIAIKLNKPAQQFQAGDSTGFGIRGGVKYYDRKTKSEKWTNYQAAVFAKNQQQIDFYAGNLIEGAVVTVSGESIAVEEFKGQQGPQIALVLNNARIEYIASPSQVRAPDAAQQVYTKAVAQLGPITNAPAGFESFDDDIPF